MRDKYLYQKGGDYMIPNDQDIYILNLDEISPEELILEFVD